MNLKNRLLTFSSVLILTLLVSLAFPIIAFADDETPPPASTGEPALPSEDEAASQQEPDVAEIMEALPPDTELVVLGNEGEALPLASQEAADVILSDPDPMWCPQGQTPGTDVLLDGIQDCTNSFNRFTTASGLINTLEGGSYSGPGTIYVSSGNIAGADQGKNITLNGTSLTTLSATDLTIQGGWDFGSDSVNNRSVFVNSTLEIKNWTGNITVNDLKFELASGIGGDGLTIKNITGNVTINNIVITDSDEDDGLFVNNIDGNVDVNDSKFTDNAGNGATIQNATDVTITGSEFRRNDKGLEVSNVDIINLNDVLAQNNDLQGADLSAYTSVTVYGGSSFNKNSRQGLRADAYTVDISDSEAVDNGTDGTDRSGFRADGYDVTLSNVYAADNGLFGANIHAANSATIEDGSLFEYNDGNGLNVFSDGSITLKDVTASNNDGNGADLDNGCGCMTGDITISSSVFNENDESGLNAYSAGNITLNSVTANDNYYNGAWLDNTYGSGNVSIYDSTFDDNVEDDEDAGLNVDSNGFVTLSNISASNNGGDGVNIGYDSGFYGNPYYVGWTGALIEKSVFNDNWGVDDDWGWGLYLEYGIGDVTIDDVTAARNLYNGLFVGTTGNVTIKNSQFIDTDDDDGIELDIDGNAVICDTTISGNDEYGLDADDVSGNLTLNNVTFTNNGSGPADDYFYGGSGTVTIGSVGCIPSSGGGSGKSGSGLPGSIIPVTGGGSAEFNCELFSSTTLMLTNGDSVTFKCPISGSGALSPLGSDALPGGLPEGVTYASGLNAVPSPAGSDTALDGQVVISFIIPEGQESADFAILYWNGSEWVDLKDATFEDGREVVNGGSNTGDGHFQAVTNFSGTFILVTK
jgi:hypothetical protein